MGWQTYKLGDLGTFKNGVNFNKNDFGNEVPVVNVTNLFRGRFATTNDLDCINLAAIPRIKDYQLKTGDILFARSSVKASGAGQVAMVNHLPDSLTVFSGFIIRYRIHQNEILDSHYLNYLLRSPFFRSHFQRIGTGTSITNLTQAALSNVEIEIPELTEQKAIAKILSSLDDKIELNRRMNATLEAIARALFKAWFVDFEPVHANLENRPSTSASPEIARFFPSEFENGIPKGWHTKKISECCDVARGASPRPIHDFIGDDIPWVKIADATAAGSFFIFDTKEKIKASGKDMSVFLTKGSLILSNSATCGIPMFLELDGCIHDGWLYFKNYRGVSSDYLFEALARMTERLVGEADGTVQKNLNTGIISRQEIVVPSPKVMSTFEEIHMSLFEKIKGNTVENSKLSDIRDLLLPRLISGKLNLEILEI